MRLDLHESRYATRATRRAILALCFLFCLAGRGEAADRPSANPHTTSSLLNANFAIADFDGDQKPDLATVEVQKSGSFARTEYSIRFELAAGATQVFGVTAPAGGLQIQARDVNGDDALDLLVSTAWQQTQVAVLLNDGHGNFTLAAPGTYPAAVSERETRWIPGASLVSDSVALLRVQNSSGSFEKRHGMSVPPTAREGYSARGLNTLPGLAVFTRRGRAPPALILQS
jgi:hypothetical protein